jgi:hypothetical protein
MARPTDWIPLGLEADPVPGDPARISQEAAHLATAARTISNEVAALRKIAAGGADAALKGQYVDQIHSAASDLAGQLDKVVGRYQKVSSALGQWVTDLEHAQSQSITALNQAEAPYQRIANTAKPPTVPSPTPAQQQAARDYATSTTRAQGELDDAKTLLNRATTFRDQRASHYASVIRAAIDDGVKDSWWQSHVLEWIDRNAGWLKTLATVLEVIATIAAVLALIFTGVGIFVLIGLAATLVAAGARLLLAVAGDGSWLDFAMDVVSLLTFGIGGKILAGMKGVLGSSTKIAEGLIDAERDATLLGKAANVASKVSDFAVGAASKFSDLVDSNVTAKLADGFLKDVISGAGDLGEKALSGVSGAAGNAATALNEMASPSLDLKVAEETKVGERLLNGGTKEPVTLTRQMNIIMSRFPDAADLVANQAKFNSLLKVYRLNFGIAGATGLGTQLAGGLSTGSFDIGSVHIPEVNVAPPWSGAYGDAQKFFTRSIGGWW